jgi:hypothetical protein
MVETAPCKGKEHFSWFQGIVSTDSTQIFEVPFGMLHTRMNEIYALRFIGVSESSQAVSQII